jgi:cytochrome c
MFAMDTLRKLACAAGLPAGVNLALAADGAVEAGRKVFQRRCQTCHGITGPADPSLGPSLAGIVGRQSGSADTGVHSRANVAAGTVWTRNSLRRYLSDPARDLPGTIMSAQLRDPQELDAALSFLEALR